MDDYSSDPLSEGENTPQPQKKKKKETTNEALIGQHRKSFKWKLSLKIHQAFYSNFSSNLDRTRLKRFFVDGKFLTDSHNKVRQIKKIQPLTFTVHEF